MAALPLLWLIFAVLGLGGLTLNASYKAYFDPEDSMLQLKNEFELQFNRPDGLVVLVGIASHDSADSPTFNP